MDKLKCLTCQVALPTPEDQREHYKGEWHLYNLKRKLNQMKCITEDEFLEIKNKHQQEQQQNKEHSDQCSQSSMYYCNACSKSFLSPKAFEQHNSSNKHVRQLSMANNKMVNNNKFQQQQQNDKQSNQVPKSMPEKTKVEEEEEFNEDDWEEFDEDEELEEPLETIPVEECLFCGHVSNNIETNLSHMSKTHSFFIPDVEYCSDVKGLLNYLGTKIADGKCCLWCSDHGKSFASKKSAQRHMMDVGHTKVNFHNRPESLLEFEDFYDYSSSYPEQDEGEVGDEEEEDDDQDDVAVLDGDDYQLKLPSGAVIGNRALFVYYKQKLRPQTSRALVVKQDRSKNMELLNKVTSVYQSLGWTGQKDRSAALKYARDVHYMNRMAKKMNLKLGQKHNTTKQSHFRSQIGF